MTKTQSRRGKGPRARGAVVTERRSSRDAVLHAALRVADTEGLDALTMRRVAAELDIPVMTLYGFVRTKDEILNGLADLALGDVHSDYRADEPWADQLTVLIRKLRHALSTHPGVVELILTHAVSSGNFDHIREAILQTLHTAGFERRDALDAMGALVNYALGFAVAEGRRARFPEQTANEPLRLRQLHPSQFPRLTDTADDYLSHLSERAFEAGLEYIINGFRARLPSETDPTR